jgi:hypothetical protein
MEEKCPTFYWTICSNHSYTWTGGIICFFYANLGNQCPEVRGDSTQEIGRTKTFWISWVMKHKAKPLRVREHCLRWVTFSLFLRDVNVEWGIFSSTLTSYWLELNNDLLTIKMYFLIFYMFVLFLKIFPALISIPASSFTTIKKSNFA